MLLTWRGNSDALDYTIYRRTSPSSGFNQVAVAISASNGDPGSWTMVSVTSAATAHEYPRLATEPRLGIVRLAYWTRTGVYVTKANASSLSSWIAPQLATDYVSLSPAYDLTAVAAYPRNGSWWTALVWTDFRRNVTVPTIYYTSDRVDRVPITVTTDPPGLEVSVAGVSYTAPYTFGCEVYSTPTIGATSPQVTADTENTFSAWSDGGGQFHGIFCSEPATYTASFDTTFAVTVDTAPQGLDVIVDGVRAPSPFFGWWSAGSVHNLAAPSPQGNGTSRFVFRSWSDGGSQNRSVVASGPSDLVAAYSEEYRVTVDTVPAGLWVQVDGAWYRSPQSFWLGRSSMHALSVNDTQGALRFVSWSDGGGRSHAVAIGGPATYTAAYGAAPQPLTLNASAEPAVGQAPLAVRFTATGSGGNGNYLWRWEFGDGSSSSERNPPWHVYADPGAYVATVWLNDTGGNTTSRRISLTVTSAPTPVTGGNWKPLVAAVSAFVLALVGAWSARRAPWPTGSRRRLRAFVLTALPFVVAEASTGIVSYATGLLTIPPVLGLGAMVDGAILVVGISVAVVRLRRPRANV